MRVDLVLRISTWRAFLPGPSSKLAGWRPSRRVTRARVGFFATAAPIAVSRVYGGAHDATDARGDAPTGIIVAVILRLVYREGTRADRLVP
jgi:membrane-associated phospholipid phosphatase